jgi:hypothetical protein
MPTPLVDGWLSILERWGGLHAPTLNQDGGGAAGRVGPRQLHLVPKGCHSVQ